MSYKYFKGNGLYFRVGDKRELEVYTVIANFNKGWFSPYKGIIEDLSAVTRKLTSVTEEEVNSYIMLRELSK